MVVIEATGDEEHEIRSTKNPAAAAADDGDTEPETEKETETETASVSNKDVSEGFETASEGDHFETDEEVEQPQLPQEQVVEEGKQEQTVKKDDSYQDAFDDEELKQKALERANDAKAEGNALFKEGQYEDALSKYEFALQRAPEMPSSVELRSICHSNSAVCFFKMGKYNEAVKECTKALELNPAYVKALVKRGEALEKLERYDEAIADMKKILELDPSNDQARRNIIRLEPIAKEKMEKMKEEMMGKLKEMGNSLLGRFGMSIDNFKTVQDPNTGSYSVQFQR